MGSGVQKNDVTRSVATRSTDDELPDIVTDAEDSREAQVRAGAGMGLDMCVSRGPDDNLVEVAGTTTNLTKEPNQLETCGTLLQEPIVVETMPRGHVCSQKTETACDRPVDEVKNNRNKSMFVAAKLTRDVMDDVHDGTMALETLRMAVNLVTTHDGEHRLCNSVFQSCTRVQRRPCGFLPKVACWRKESASCCCRLGLRRSYAQRTTTTGLISFDAGEHCIDSLRAGNKRQRWRTDTQSLQSSSPRGVLMYIENCGNSFTLTQYRKGSVWLHQWTGQRTAW